MSSEEESDNEVLDETVPAKKQKVTYTTAPRKLETSENEEKSDEEEEDDFRRQLRLEKEEAERLAKKKTRIDPDGTEYEYDEQVKGWFPKIPDEKFIQYQNSYATSAASNRVPQANEYYLYNGKFYSWDPANNKWIDPTEPVYAYTDYLTGIKYKWNQEANQWQQIQAPESSQSQANTAAAATKPTTVEGSQTDKKEKGWFDINENRNTNVYVTGLPLDITDEEFESIMSKYGIIAKDVETNKLKVKLYRDENNEAKGDGRCCYLMPESVQLCLQLLDASDYKGHKIHVEKAKFEMKGNYDPNKSGKVKKRNKNKEKKILEKQRQKLLGWEEAEAPRGKHEKVVVIKGLFDLNNFGSSQAEKLKDDLQHELSQYGEVKKIIVNEKNPLGIATVSFVTVDDADICCDYLNNRVWKNGRVITCETWDGKTKYDVEETEEERQKRIDEWHKFIEAGEEEEEDDDENGSDGRN